MGTNKNLARIFAGRVKRRIKDMAWEMYGMGIKIGAPSKPPRSILFICKGNICRSPFADRLAKKMFDGVPGHKPGIDSAGLEVKMPCASPKNAVEAAAGFGIDLEDHRSKPFQAEMCAEFDMIVAMETGQYKGLVKKFADSQAKFFLLPFFENNSTRPGGYERYNLSDPYGKSLEEFNRCFRRIERCIAGMARVINTQ
jgi:protein-tyrosine phosphatase